MKTKEELKQLKEEYELINNKLKELSEEELKQVAGGNDIDIEIFNNWEILPTITGFNSCEFENNKTTCGGAINCNASAANDKH